MNNPKIYKIGERWLIPITLRKEGSPLDVSTGTVTARLIYLNNNEESEQIGSTSLSSSISGADWANGLVIVDFSAISTSGVTVYNNLFIEVTAVVGTDTNIFPVRELEVEKNDFISIPLIPFSDFEDSVLIEIPDAPLPLINLKIQETIKDFCKRTNGWKETINLTGLENVVSYNLPTNGNAKIIQVISLSVNDYIYNSNSYKLNDCEIEFDGNMSPNKDSEIKIIVSMLPIGLYCPDFFITHYKRELVSGVISKLMKMPRRPFSNLNESIFYEKEYFKAVGQELYKQSSRGVYGAGGIIG
tara:strand:- start:91 stop:993 length:903 start_codon:yes stop_codon:yes gene_type:complete